MEIISTSETSANNLLKIDILTLFLHEKYIIIEFLLPFPYEIHIILWIFAILILKMLMFEKFLP